MWLYRQPWDPRARGALFTADTGSPGPDTVYHSPYGRARDWRGRNADLPRRGPGAKLRRAAPEARRRAVARPAERCVAWASVGRREREIRSCERSGTEAHELRGHRRGGGPRRAARRPPRAVPRRQSSASPAPGGRRAACRGRSGFHGGPRMGPRSAARSAGVGGARPAARCRPAWRRPRPDAGRGAGPAAGGLPVRDASPAGLGPGLPALPRYRQPDDGRSGAPARRPPPDDRAPPGARPCLAGGPAPGARAGPDRAPSGRHRSAAYGRASPRPVVGERRDARGIERAA